MSTRSLCFLALLLPTFVGCAEEDVSSTDDATDFLPSEGPSEDLVEVAEDVWAPADQADLFAAVIDERELAAAEGREPQSDLDVMARELDMSREEVAASYAYLVCTGSGGGTTTWTRCTGNAADTCSATVRASASYREPLRGGSPTSSAYVSLSLTNSTTTPVNQVTMLSVNGQAATTPGTFSPGASASGHVYPNTSLRSSVTASGSRTDTTAGIDPYSGSYSVATNSLEFIYYKTTGNAIAHQSTSFPITFNCAYSN